MDKALVNAVQICNKAIKYCPAYKDFLNKYFKQPLSFINNDTFQEIPLTDKTIYLNGYDFSKKLYLSKELSSYYMICSSSGSTGEPTIWPRDKQLDTRLPTQQFEFLNDHFHIAEKTTLIVIMFGLGLSMAGMLTAKLCWESADKGKISVATPGIDILGAINLIDQIHRYYDQVIIMGYPPIVKEAIDLALQKKMKLNRWNLKFALTGENISLEWKTSMLKTIGYSGEYVRIMTFYACSESGIIGIETPQTQKINHNCITNIDLRKELYGSIYLPSLVMYDPFSKYIEIINDEIILTVDQAVPLVRYNLHDRGKLLKGKKIRTILQKYGISLSEINDFDSYLCVFGKNDLPNSKGFFNVEDIKYALDMSGLNLLTGYFQYNETYLENNLTIYVVIYLKTMDLLNFDIEKKIKKKITNNFKQILITKKIIQPDMKFNLDLKFMKDPGSCKYSRGKLKYYL